MADFSAKNSIYKLMNKVRDFSLPDNQLLQTLTSENIPFLTTFLMEGTTVHLLCKERQSYTVTMYVFP
jgi:hypothetical protein